MKRKILWLHIILLLAYSAAAADVFHLFKPLQGTQQNLIKEISNIKSEFFEINFMVQNEIIDIEPDEFRMELLINDEMRIINLKKSDIFSPDFKVEFSDKKQTPGNVDLGIHYWGNIEGVENSLVAFSVYKNEVIGFFSSPGINKILGKMRNQEVYILYDDSKLPNPNKDFCGVAFDGELEVIELGGIETGPNGNCVEIYIEVGNDVYLDKGANTTTYITGLFNQSAALYNNEQIPIVLQAIFIWNSADPYNAGTSLGRLNEFRNYRTSFDGDIGHLVDYGGMGGIAPVNGLCSSITQRMCYSGIHPSYSTVPTYSWSILVFTHEMGHVFGSWHTHDCVWNGNNTAIDGCGPTAGYPPQIGGCPTGPIPAGGGTIMSYCHLLAVGTNFSLGFGQQPGDLIRSRLNTVTCLGNCCEANITITGTYTLSHIESDTWIQSSGSTTVASGSSLKLDANPSTGGYIELNDGFLADAGSTFTAQALNGCTTGLPQRNTGSGNNYDINERSTAIKLFPNPTTGTTLLSSSVKLDYINVYNSMGKIVLTKTNIDSGSLDIDLSAFPNGIYLFEIIDIGQNKRTGKVSLQK